MSQPPLLPHSLATVNSRLQRLVWLDLARTVALLAMVVFHSARDMELFGLLQAGTTLHSGWAIFARLIAGTFIFLSGVSLVLAQGRQFDPGKWFRRILRISAAAVLVSVATYVAFPDRFVYFGILHLIATANLIGALLLPLKDRLLAVVTASVILLASFPPDLFASPLLGWTGLSSTVRPSLDHLPLIPCLAPFLAGMAAARLLPISQYDIILKPNGFINALTWPGRYRLLVYLLHQPMLLGIFWLIQKAI